MDKEIRRIPLNLDYLSLFKTLKLEQVGEITLSVMGKYANGEKIDIQSEITKAYALVWCNDVDIAITKKTERTQKNRTNGGLGGKAKAQNERERKARAQAEYADEETAPPSDGIPLADVKEVEPYPFEEFWKIYKKDVGHDKCLQIWECQLSDEVKAKIMAHVVKYVQARPNEYFRKDPINYFKDRTYEDEVITNTPQSASNYGSNNVQSYKEAEFERNARTAIENLQRAERGELAYLSPFNPPSGQR